MCVVGRRPPSQASKAVFAREQPATPHKSQEIRDTFLVSTASVNRSPTSEHPACSRKHASLPNDVPGIIYVTGKDITSATWACGDHWSGQPTWYRSCNERRLECAWMDRQGRFLEAQEQRGMLQDATKVLRMRQQRSSPHVLDGSGNIVNALTRPPPSPHPGKLQLLCRIARKTAYCCATGRMHGRYGDTSPSRYAHGLFVARRCIARLIFP